MYSSVNRTDSASMTGAIVTVISSLTLSDWGVILGILFGLSTLLINWYYKDREIKLKEKYYQQQLKEMNDEQTD
ncbi:MAG: phage holin [Pasteurellaceae bacterium]|nr:phage holin [Pasteurellaceae bacterium]